MAADFDVFTIGAIALDGVQLDAADNFNQDYGLQLFRHRTSGRIHFSQQGVLNQQPSFTFDTPEVETVLTKLGANFVHNIDTTVIVYWTKMDEAARSSGGDHLITTINEGLVFPTSLTWSGANDVWKIALEIRPTWDGTNLPLVLGTASLPARALPDEAFVGGKMVMELAQGQSTEQLDGWQSATLNFGFNVRQENSKGHPYPGIAYVLEAAPTLQLVGMDPGERTDYTQDGKRLFSAILYLRKAATNTTDGVLRVADGTSEHIKLLFGAGLVRNITETASGGNPAQITVEITPDETAAAEWMVYTANSAIA